MGISSVQQCLKFFYDKSGLQIICFAKDTGDIAGVARILLYLLLFPLLLPAQQQPETYPPLIRYGFGKDLAVTSRVFSLIDTVRDNAAKTNAGKGAGAKG